MTGPHVLRMRVAWADTDAGGRIHWSAVFRWAELAEHDLLRRLGRHADQAGPYPRRATNAIYHRPLVFDNVFDLELDVAAMGRSSVTFAWRAVHEGTLCVEGTHTVIHVGPEGRGQPWPEYLREGLTAHLADNEQPESGATNTGTAATANTNAWEAS